MSPREKGIKIKRNTMVLDLECCNVRFLRTHLMVSSSMYEADVLDVVVCRPSKKISNAGLYLYFNNYNDKLCCARVVRLSKCK